MTNPAAAVSGTVATVATSDGTSAASAATDTAGLPVDFAAVLEAMLAVVPATVADEEPAATDTASPDAGAAALGDVNGIAALLAATTSSPAVAALPPPVPTNPLPSGASLAAKSDSATTPEGETLALLAGPGSGGAQGTAPAPLALAATGQSSDEATAIFAAPEAALANGAAQVQVPGASGQVLAGPSPGPTAASQHAVPANPTPSTPSPVRLDTPLGDPRWAADFGQRIVWLARQDSQSAQLSLNPANLGPIEINLNLGRDNASAIFSSPHADVREALEAALPRLREMLAGAGISLGQAQVNSQAQQHAQDQGNRSGSRPYGETIDGAILQPGAETGPLGHRMARSGAGLVDIYA